MQPGLLTEAAGQTRVSVKTVRSGLDGRHLHEGAPSMLWIDQAAALTSNSKCMRS
jgi:hypothetical protein